MFSSKIKILIIISVSCLFFTTCKKYPENTHWFRKPEAMIQTSWKLDKYYVNGVDSGIYEDTKMYREKEMYFGQSSITYYEQFQGSWKLLKKKKEIVISATHAGNLILYTAQKNIFHSNSKWSIKKLNSEAFWLNTTANNNSYEIRLSN